MDARHVNWRSISLDYETAVWNCLRNTAENYIQRTLDIVGCLFHYSQAVIKAISTLGLIVLYRDASSGLQSFVSRLIALAFMPAHKVEHCYNILVTYYFPVILVGNTQFAEFIQRVIKIKIL
jgi:hypothetical protein